jgi:hypothetical protein
MAEARPVTISTPTGVLSPVGIDRARRLAWLDVQRTDTNQILGPATDPTHSHWIHKFDLGKEFKLFYGQVVDEVAYINCYKVQVERAGSTIWCTAGVQTALQPVGARQFGQIPIGASVLFALHPTENTGNIICVLPEPAANGQTCLADFISQAGRSGLLVDAAHNSIVAALNASMTTDWSSGRPFDQTSTGEFGAVTETGLMHFIDSFMSFNRVDEECGVWHFYLDSLTRIAGHNMEVFTAGTEQADVDDEGEFDSVKGVTPYYWEALGTFEFGTPVCRTILPECWQKDPALQGYSGVEPCSDLQQPFYRLQDFHGYLGQGTKRVLCILPQDTSSSVVIEEEDPIIGEGFPSCEPTYCDVENINEFTDYATFPGVFDENLALTGRWTVRSAHEIIFSKQVFIPTPKRMRLPQDANGDTSTNYQAAGVYSTFGVPHLVVGEIAVPLGDDPSQIRAAGFLDTHAFAFNWVGEHPFYYHALDWYLPNEADLGYIPATDPITFSSLSCSHFLSAPPPIALTVDHRYGDVEYYPNHSYFGMLADGGFVIGDGFGAEIKMANGHMWITTPGDANIHVGRDIVNFAGRDFITRAYNSWDITATNRDGRLKAHNNLWMAATGANGGVLIQSLATNSYTNDATGELAAMGGISISAPDSLLSIDSKHTTFTTSDQSAANVLTFDVGWQGKIRFKCKNLERFMNKSGSMMDFWVTPSTGDDPCGGTVIAGTEWWAAGALICTPLVVDANILSSGCIMAQGNLYSTNGHVATASAVNDDGLVGYFGGPSPNFSYFATRNSSTLPSIGNSELSTLCSRQENYTYNDQDFTFRSAAEYRTSDFVLFESRWQQMARLTSDDVIVWVEESVYGTYPYPGATIINGASYRTLDLNLYDVATGIAIPRGADYETPEFDTPAALTLDGNYIILQ